MKSTMMFAMALGTVMVNMLPAQAGDQPQPASLATSNATAQAGIDFANSSSLNVGGIPTKVLTVKEAAGSCAGGAFIPTFQSEPSLPTLLSRYNFSDFKPHSIASGGSSSEAITETQSNPDSTTASEAPAYLSTPFPGSAFTTRTATTEGELTASFVSSTTPPASGLRVRIENVTPGMEGVRPYSDREYDEGGRSEAFTVRFGKQHNGGYLAVGEGDNEFTYQIKRGDQIVESGTFKARVDRQVETEIQSISLEQKQLQCQASAPLPKPLSTDLIGPQNTLDDRRKLRDEIERAARQKQERFRLPPQQLPTSIPRIQMPPVQIQQNFQSPRLIPPTSSPLLTPPLFPR